MKSKPEIIGKLQKFLENESYETDTLSIDVIDIGKIGNVLQSIQDKECAETVFSFLKTAKSMFFSI